MKKNHLLLVIGVVVAVLALYFLLFWPPIKNEDASGAYKKADKYKDYIIGDNDIILRTEMLKDSNATKKLILDLMQLSDFAVYVKGVMNELWVPTLRLSNSSPEINEAIAAIKQFSDFIDNNNKVVHETILTIAELGTSGSNKSNVDVEQKLKQYYNFINQFMIRDSIFENTISNIDFAIFNNTIPRNEVEKIINLRNQIVIDNLLYGLVTADTSKILYSSAQRILNSNVMNSGENLNSFEKNLLNAQNSINSLLQNGFPIIINILSNSNIDNYVAPPNANQAIGFLDLVGAVQNMNSQSYLSSIANNNAIQSSSVPTYFSFTQDNIKVIFGGQRGGGGDRPNSIDNQGFAGNMNKSNVNSVQQNAVSSNALQYYSNLPEFASFMNFVVFDQFNIGGQVGKYAGSKLDFIIKNQLSIIANEVMVMNFGSFAINAAM